MQDTSAIKSSNPSPGWKGHWQKQKATVSPVIKKPTYFKDNKYYTQIFMLKE